MSNLRFEDIIKEFDETEWWGCKVCTYSNPDSFKTCYLCGADRKGKGAMSIVEAAVELGTFTFSKVRRLVK